MKIKSELIFGLLVSTILLSCEDKNDEQAISINNTVTMIEDFNTNQINCSITIDSLHPHVINNFATHSEIPFNENQSIYTIFLGQSTNELGFIYPLSPITEFVKNEYSVKKIIASWHKDSTRMLTDSIYLKVTNIDSNFHKRLVYTDHSFEDSTMIYINLLNINRYGYAKINLNNPDINNYLVYNTNINSDKGINITAQEFRDRYGDAFCSSLTLGTFNLIQGVIYGVKAQHNSRGDALEEAMNMVKIYLTEGKGWEELVVNSKYLKNSLYLEHSKSSMGYSGNLIGNYQDFINSADSLYRLGEFNHYSSGFQLYSKLYPNFEFIDAKFPY